MRDATKIVMGLFLFAPLFLQAQIVITNQDRPSANTNIVYLIDDLVENYTLPEPGPDQVFNYDTIDATGFFGIPYVDPATLPLAVDYPEADVAVALGPIQVFLDYRTEGTWILGETVDTDGSGTNLEVVPYIEPRQIAQFPYTLGDSFTDFASYTLTIDGGNTIFDSIRRKVSILTTDWADASGSVGLPNIGFFDALHVCNRQIVTDSISVLTSGGYELIQVNTDTIQRFTWIAKETQGPLLQATPLPEGGFQVVYFSDLIAVPFAAFSYENEGMQAVRFIDESGNFPSGWLWDFGDGQTSNLQNPTHDYAADGVYEVCLRVNNEQGVDSLCQTVTVMPVHLHSPLLDNQLLVYPNPTDDAVHFEWNSAPIARMRLQLYDASGRRLQNHTMQGNLSISLKHLPAGIYFYHISDADGRLLTKGQLSKH